MQAAYIRKTGSFDEIQVGELPVPQISDTEVLIKVQAVAVNHVDTFVRSGGFKTELNYPAVIGRDAVGTIVTVGAQVDQFQVGQLVWTNSMGYAGRPGITSAFAAIPATRLFHVPAGVAPKQLVGAVHSAATAVILLQSILQVQPGETVLIEGAAGHVGTKLVQVAAAMQAQVLTTANPRDFDRLRVIGGIKCFDYHADFASLVAQARPAGVAAIVDTSGKVPLATNLALLGLGGRIGLITAPVTNQFTFDVRQFYTQQQAIRGFVISHATLAQLQAAGKVVNQLMTQGKLLDDQLEVLPFSQAVRSHQLLEKGQTKAKIVLIPD